MGLFNPIKGQFETLQRAMDDRKTIRLADAAAAMNVKPEKVDHSLLIMTKRGMFGDDCPYVDDSIRMVVLDKRYANYALTQYAVEKLGSQLEKARKMPGKLKNAILLEYNRSNSGKAGAFFRNLAVGVLNGDGVGNSLLNATDHYINDGKKAQIDLPDTQTMEEILTGMLSDTREMADLMLMHPDDLYTKDIAEWLNSVTFDVQSWQGCLESAFARKNKGNEMLRLEEKFTNRHRFELHDRKEAMKGVKKDTQERSLSRDIYLCCSEMQKKKTLLRNEDMRGAVDSIVELLADIHSHLMVGKNLTGRGSMQSLRSCYLPMVVSLTDQYISYEGLRTRDENTLRAMRETEQVMSNDVPEALRKMLEEIGAGNAIDMESQAEALKHKLQLDGLVDMRS